MNEKHEKHRDLIRALINSLINSPEKLTIESRGFRGITYWHVTPAGDDYPMINGQGGDTIRPLFYLVSLLGHACGQTYNLRLDEPHPGPRRGFVKTELARKYDPAAAKALLTELLGEYLTDPFRVDIAATHSVPLRFVFNLEATTRPDHEFLTERADNNPAGIAFLDAIRTIFTAYGRREGVQFKIEVR